MDNIENKAFQGHQNTSSNLSAEPFLHAFQSSGRSAVMSSAIQMSATKPLLVDDFFFGSYTYISYIIAIAIIHEQGIPINLSGKRNDISGFEHCSVLSIQWFNLPL